VSDSEPDDLEEVRRAALELRERNPSEAVRVLRKLVKRGGEIEPLAHGALGEILLEDFDDVDGALHHFRKLLALAPGLPAGELGLARALARNGIWQASQDAYVHAFTGFEALAKAGRAAPDVEAAGMDECVLTLLEIAVEERQMCEECKTIVPRTEVSRELLDWAEASRIFDDEDDPEYSGDWIRFTGLRTELALLRKDPAEAARIVERLGKFAPLPLDVLEDMRSQLSGGLVTLGVPRGRGKI
jgi:hypothetical protein